jgi:hypothetical protein
MMIVQRLYPDLDFGRAWHGGELLPARPSTTPLGEVARELPDEDLTFTPAEIARIDRVCAGIPDPAPLHRPWLGRVPRPCACRCGGIIQPPYWPQQRFLPGHNPNGRPGR